MDPLSAAGGAGGGRRARGEAASSALAGASAEQVALCSTRARVEAALRALSASISKAQSELSDVAMALAMDAPADGAHPDELHIPLPEQRESCPLTPSYSRDGDTVRDAASHMQSSEAPDAAPRASSSEETSSASTDVECHHNAILLPEMWPGSLEIRWGNREDKTEGMAVRRTNSRKFSKIPHAGSFERDQRDPFESEQSLVSQQLGAMRGTSECLVIRPSSKAHIFHCCACTLLLLHDVFVIPWRLAWDLPPLGVWQSVAWTTSVLWTLDICLNFMTGFYENGEIVTAWGDIAKKYLRSWFALDAILVAADWAVLLVGSSPALKTLRVLKLGKLIRLLSVFRLVKFAHTITELIQNSVSDFTRLALAFVNPSIGLLFVVHLQACGWFLIGRSAPSDTGMRWTGTGLSDITEEPLLYQYTTSAHWAISQVTLGATEVNSSTSIERIYTIACLFEGILLGSTLISTCSSTMLQISMDKREAQLKIQQLRRYLRENNVDHELAVMVQRQLTERLETKGKLEEHQVEGLKLLSSSLKDKLRFHMYEPHLSQHPLFFVWINLDKTFAQRFCAQCMNLVHFNKEDDMFTPGKEAEAAYFLSSGTIKYVQEPESSPVDSHSETTVGPGLWLAEPAMWTHWIHVGSARALEFCEAMEVRVEKLGEVLQYATIVQVTYDYCMRFHQRVQLAKPPASTWPDDLRVPATDQSLADEVRQGRCTVMLNSDGDLVRVTSVVALKILDSRDDMLIQIGKRGPAELEPACQLPGGKQDRGERVKNTLDRLLQTKLAPLRDHVEITHMERVVQWNDSLAYGVRTKYIRNVVTARLKSQAVLDNALSVSRTRSHASRHGERSADTLAPASPLAAHDALWQRDVFPIADSKGGLCVYAWFSEQEFERMAGEHGKYMLPFWLSRLGAQSP